MGSRCYLRLMEQDTTPGQLRLYHERLRAMTPAQRLRQASALSLTVRALAEAGIRLRNPRADSREVRVRLAVRLYGRPAARRLYGEIPDDAI